MARRATILAILIMCLLVAPATAFAYNEGGSVDPALTACPTCHGSGPASMTSGPHGGYTATGSQCAACHTLHKGKAAGKWLLPRDTVRATCDMCHDGTGGRGVYGVYKARGITVVSSHSIDATNVVPGGNASTGGTITMAFSGPGGTLSCADCHSPHGSSIATFTGERKRTATDTTFISNRLLRTRPGGITYDVKEYGSDWCGACHKGRLYISGLHNHPVETSSVAGYYYYEKAAILSTDVNASTATTGTLARTNRGFLMLGNRSVSPYRVGLTQHYPVCQQCHADPRSVGVLADSGVTATANPWSVTAMDGLSTTDSPRLQVFPHESSQTAMLVEMYDDLCTNCHPVGLLP